VTKITWDRDQNNVAQGASPSHWSEGRDQNNVEKFTGSQTFPQP